MRAALSERRCGAAIDEQQGRSGVAAWRCQCRCRGQSGVAARIDEIAARHRQIAARRGQGEEGTEEGEEGKEGQGEEREEGQGEEGEEGPRRQEGEERQVAPCTGTTGCRTASA